VLGNQENAPGMSRSLRILWLKTGPLHPLDTGGKLRTYHMLRELSRAHHVTYLSLLPPDAPPEATEKAGEYSRKQIWIPWRETPKRSPAFFAELAANLVFSRLPYVITKYRSEAMAKAIRDEDDGRHDLIVCDFLTPAVNLFAGQRTPRTPTLLFQHNVESLIWQRMHENARGPAKRYLYGQWRRMQRFEREACGKCKGVVAVSDADGELLREKLGLRNVLGSVPTGVDIDYFQSATGSRKPASLVFLGSMDWMPNIDGALWFAEKIWPEIKEKVPGATWTIVGRKPTAAIQALATADPAIRVTGTVEDVRPYLAEAELMIVPLRVGGGTRIKIYEGMAAGVPVISTTIGAEGLCIRHGENIVLADDPEAFARMTIDLLAQKKRREALGQAGQALVRDHFSWRSVAGVFAGYCEALSSNPP
jgi:glycosyltransferase involved in cell wall biosynthesis